MYEKAHDTNPTTRTGTHDGTLADCGAPVVLPPLGRMEEEADDDPEQVRGYSDAGGDGAEKVTYIYVMASSGSRHKVGVSRSPESRLSALRAQYPFLERVHRVWAMSEPDVWNVEKTTHRALARFRQDGEIFDCDLDHITTTVEGAISFLGINAVPYDLAQPRQKRAAIKTAMLGIRLKPEVREHLVSLAKADGRPLSQYVVERLIMPHLAAFPVAIATFPPPPRRRA